MGIVVRQSFKTLIITYLGLIVGYINTLFLYPLVLTDEQIGLIRLLISVTFLFATFASLGAINIPAKFFPYFDNKEEKHKGFLFFLFILGTFGFLIFSILFVSAKHLIFSIYYSKAKLLTDYYYYFIPFTLIALYYSIMDSYIVIQKKPVIPNFVKEFFTRFMIATGMVLIWLKLLNFQHFVVFVMYSYLLALLILLIYSKKLQVLFLKPDLNFFKNKYFKEVIVFGGFVLFGNASSLLISNIDGIMLSAYKGLGSTGVYIIAFFIATVIEIPKRSISQSVIPLVSEANKNENTEQMEALYKKSSINQLIIGGLIFIGVWCNIENIFHLMPNSSIYIQGKWVVFYIGISKLFDMATGINAEIVGTSKYYKLDLLFLILLGIITVITNMIFIPIWGMTGAALASAISVFIFNSMRFVFILKKFRIQPFTGNTIKVLLIGFFTLTLNTLLPLQSSLYFDLILRSLLIFIIYSGLVLAFKTSEDLNAILVKKIKRFKL
jgi:O-antigen/teichoic acid export membrane protein